MATFEQSERVASVLRMQQAEAERDRNERQQLWTFVWILFAFKLVSVGILIWWIEWNTFLYVVGMTSWFWLVIPSIALAGPILNRQRMRRMRKKRAALQRAEFGPDRAGVNLMMLDRRGELSNLYDAGESTGERKEQRT